MNNNEQRTSCCCTGDRQRTNPAADTTGPNLLDIDWRAPIRPPSHAPEVRNP